MKDYSTEDIIKFTLKEKGMQHTLNPDTEGILQKWNDKVIRDRIHETERIEEEMKKWTKDNTYTYTKKNGETCRIFAIPHKTEYALLDNKGTYIRICECNTTKLENQGIVRLSHWVTQVEPIRINMTPEELAERYNAVTVYIERYGYMGYAKQEQLDRI